MRAATCACFLLLLTCLVAPQETVPDPVTAVKIGEAASKRVYGKRKIESEESFKATLDNKVWTIAGTLHCKDSKGRNIDVCAGGVAEVKISKVDGRILSMMHTK
jgi:hypothetical protein